MCIENHRYLVREFAHACRDARFCSWKNFRTTVARFLFLEKIFPRGGAGSAFNGWTACRFHGARSGAPERNGNYRHGGRTKEMIEVWNTTVVVDNGLSLYNWIPVRANS